MFRWLLILALIVMSGSAFAQRALADPVNVVTGLFEQQIKPILISHCLECHSDRGKGGLDLRSKQTAIHGGESGQAIVPGEPEESLLLEYVASGEMPPQGQLNAQQVAAIRNWIRAGAEFPQAPIDPFAMTTETRAGFDWWSLQPLRNVEPPPSEGRWSGHPIDRFIGAKLRSAGLNPSPAADPRTLIRRATFDLTGLPPTPDRVIEFINACRQETGVERIVGQRSYEQLIDELLQSPRYGEQWGRHWLDVVRFGESNGFERNVIHETVWPFRDYVIRSLNEDKPFDQFIVEHLAGDSIDANDPQVAVGTAFLVCGPYDNVGNQDAAAAAQIRADTIDEIIRATSEAFLGLTVGCSRCHDHKFDPISQRDYYSMYATFAGVRHGERALRPNQSRRNSNAGVPTGRPSVNPRINTEAFDPIPARYVRLTILATNSSEPCIDEFEIFTTKSTDAPSRNVGLAAAGAKVTSSGDYLGNPFHKLAHINDGKYGNPHSWISNQQGRGWVQVELKDTYEIGRIVWGRDRNEQFSDRLATEYKIEVATEPGAWHTVASSADRQPFTIANGDDPNVRKWWIGKFRQEDGPFHVFIGGSPQRTGAAVHPASLSTLESAIGRYELSPTESEQRRRRKLAEWIVDPANPITPRVLVNRLWHYHFGTGIVDTPNDFGFLGGQPSHPDLLDWMAGELMRSGWRIKPMHRQIMLSKTYQQASDYRPEAASVDGNSRLLWRFPPRRLAAEEIRDASLAVAGQLDLRMGGLGFRLFKYVQDNVATYHPLDRHGPETYRRAVYHHNARAMQIDLISEFDKPDCAFSAPRRVSTTTPLQALTLMNHSFTIDMATALADRVAEDANCKDAQIDRAFHLAYLRSPSDEERLAAGNLIKQHGSAAFCRAILNSNEFLYIE